MLPKCDEKHTSSHQVWWTTNKIHSQQATPRHVIIKLLKAEERILKEARKKETYHIEGFLKRVEDDFSSETMKVRREWDDVFKAPKER